MNIKRVCFELTLMSKFTCNMALVLMSNWLAYLIPVNEYMALIYSKYNCTHVHENVVYVRWFVTKPISTAVQLSDVLSAEGESQSGLEASEDGHKSQTLVLLPPHETLFGSPTLYATLLEGQILPSNSQPDKMPFPLLPLVIASKPAYSKSL
jgi:hypothetical protein